MNRLLAAALFLSLPLSASAQEVLATFEGKPITESEVIAPVQNELREVQDAEYRLKREAVEQHLFGVLRARAAEKAGITPEELWKQEVEAKIVQPTEAEIAMTVQQYRNRLPADEGEAKKIIADALRQRNLQTRERAWRDELLAKADYRMTIEPVRYPVAALESDAVVTGPASAPVTITEFSDFQCPYCGTSQQLLDEVEEKYGEKIRIVFKQLPLDIHPQARLAAEASLCARDQGKFEPLHDWLFANARNISIETMKAAAPDLGIDAAQLETCLNEKRHTPSVNEQLAQAAALGVNSTPSFFINGRKVNERSLAAFSSLIDEELAKTK